VPGGVCYLGDLGAQQRRESLPRDHGYPVRMAVAPDTAALLPMTSTVSPAAKAKSGSGPGVATSSRMTATTDADVDVRILPSAIVLPVRPPFFGIVTHSIDSPS